MEKTVQKIRWWMDSVRGLRAHIHIYRIMSSGIDAIPISERAPLIGQLRRQEEMIGHCLLHVLLVHPAGSGRMDVE